MAKFFVFIFCLIFLSFQGCQKESISTINSSASSDGYYPKTIGSYWIYQHFRTDSNNVETQLTTLDTIKIIGDTLINGHTYSIMYGRGLPYITYTPGIIYGGYGVLGYIRDSLHYQVDTYGRIVFSSQDFNTVLHQASYTMDNKTNTLTQEMEDVRDSLTVPSGVYKVLNYKSTSSFIDHLLNISHTYPDRKDCYAKGVGRVLQSFVFADKSVFERRLWQYHIQ